MDLKIDYAGLTDDDLRTVVAEATVELDRRRTLAETPNLIAELYSRLDGAGAGEAVEQMVQQARVAEQARVTEAERARVPVEAEAQKPVEPIKPEEV